MNKKKRDRAASKGGKKRWAVAVLILLVIITGFSIAFNLVGLGVKVNNILASIPITGNLFDRMEKPKTPLELERDELQDIKSTLEEQRQNLDELANSLMLWEQQLGEKEAELEEQRTAIEELRQRLEVKVKSIQEQVTYYEKMDTQGAVKILDNIADNRLVLNILRNMKEQKCSDILAAMDPRRAARLMEAMSVE